MGAFLNVRINADGVEDKAWLKDLLGRGEAIQRMAIETEREILDIVEAKL
jgi:glutamate formiminotransferase/formiminotetrahydrofolate cyclodeaminase